jgi:hypothetical protein
MIVDKTDEHYLIHCMGLTKKQIKDMLPSEVDRHCDNVIRKEIEETGIYNPDLKESKKKKNKSK